MGQYRKGSLRGSEACSVMLAAGSPRGSHHAATPLADAFHHVQPRQNGPALPRAGAGTLKGDSVSFQAWVDESQSNRAADPDVYLLAAAVCAPAQVEEARNVMRGLLLPGQRKLHWRDEDPRRRLHIVRTLAGAPLEHLVVVRIGLVGERPERRRRYCLERLLYELDQLGVHTVTVESRGRKDDDRDRAMLDYLRRRRMLISPLHLDHQSGPSDALLWAPDAVCGAVTRARVGDVDYLAVLESKVEVITIDARQ